MMKFLGFIFLGLTLVGIGIALVKFGVFDMVANWITSFVK